MGEITLGAAWAWILAVCGAVAAVAKAWEILRRLGKGDIKRLEQRVDDREETEKILLRAMLAMVNHEIDGNGIEGLKNMRGELQEFLIKH